MQCCRTDAREALFLVAVDPAPLHHGCDPRNSSERDAAHQYPLGDMELTFRLDAR